MSDSKQIQQIVERAVAQVFERQLPKLQSELVERVLAELPAQEAVGGAAAAGHTQTSLVPAVASIHAGTSQKEILRALLDAGSSYASRVALFVVKGGSANGWQGRGFGTDEAIKDFSLDMHAGPVAHAYQNRVVTPANIAEMDGRFVQQFGGPENEQILVLPLVLKEKVAALSVCRWWRSGSAGRSVARSSGDGNERVARSIVPAKTSSTERLHGARSSRGSASGCSATRSGSDFFLGSICRALSKACGSAGSA